MYATYKRPTSYKFALLSVNREHERRRVLTCEEAWYNWLIPEVSEGQIGRASPHLLRLFDIGEKWGDLRT